MEADIHWQLLLLNVFLNPFSAHAPQHQLASPAIDAQSYIATQYHV